MKNLLLLIPVLVLANCASIATGTSQDLVINTDPSGASCDLLREGGQIGTVSPTPGQITVSKTKHDITVECSKAGYETTTYINKSGFAGSTVGNVLAGGVIGWGIDSATGADNKYEENVFIQLPKK